MRLKFLGKPRELLGKELTLDLGGRATLGDVINALPEEVQRLITDGKKFKMIVLINGVSAESRGGLEAEVGPEDEITIMPEVGGGYNLLTLDRKE